MPHRTPGARATDAASSPRRAKRARRRDRLSFRAFFFFFYTANNFTTRVNARSLREHRDTADALPRVTAARRAENDGDGRRACFDALGVCTESRFPRLPRPGRPPGVSSWTPTARNGPRWVIGRRDEACTCVSTRPRRWTATSHRRAELFPARAPTEPRARARRAAVGPATRRVPAARPRPRPRRRVPTPTPPRRESRRGSPSRRPRGGGAARVGPTHLGPDAPGRRRARRTHLPGHELQHPGGVVGGGTSRAVSRRGRARDAPEPPPLRFGEGDRGARARRALAAGERELPVSPARARSTRVRRRARAPRRR